MRMLRKGDKGADVRRWQTFLIGQNLDPGPVDGRFGESTLSASRIFQQRHGLVSDGVVGNKTLGQAMILGFPGASDRSDDERGPNFPPKPPFTYLRSVKRRALFGDFAYEWSPVAGNPENIRVTDGWASSHLTTVTLSGLSRLRGGPSRSRTTFHKSAKDQVESLWATWKKEGLSDRLLTWGGTYVPRFIRGSRTKLSNHAYGTAFDVNVPWNGLGAVPALVGKEGSVRELVEIANAHGFFWGGHYRNRLDGMHFEVAKIL